MSRTAGRGRIAAAALLLAASLAAPLAARAQAPSTSSRETRVRVSANIPNVRPVGLLRFASGDSVVVVDPHGNATRILRANITAVDTSAGRVRHPWQGLGIGLLAGGAAGMVIGFADGDDPPQEFLSMTASDKALVGGAVLGALGGVVGLVAGSLIQSDRWQRTSPAQLGMALGPRPAGGLEWRIAFSLTR